MKHKKVHSTYLGVSCLGDCGIRNHLVTFLTNLRRAGESFATALGLETGISTETRALSALRVLWARGLRIFAEFDIPDVWMVSAVAKADSRWYSRRFELVSRDGLLAGGDSVGGCWGSVSLHEFTVILFGNAFWMVPGKGSRLGGRSKLGWRPIRIGRKGFTGKGWNSGPGKVEVARCIMLPSSNNTAWNQRPLACHLRSKVRGSTIHCRHLRLNSSR